MSRAPAAIAISGLHKRFGKTHALRGLDLTVPAGTVCGLLGPNGAGKTTAVRVLATLAAPSAGRALVAGYDVTRDPDEVRSRIGFTGQHAALDENLTGWENLMLLARLHHLGGRGARARADELLERYGLADAANRLVRAYSGGMRRRLDLIASLIIRPEVLFLDEPTTGLDPRSRGEIWAAVRQLAAEGTTVLLTTQYLDEADRLAGDIAVVDHGMVIASGSPDRLKETIGVRLEATVSDPTRLPTAATVLERLSGGWASVDETERRVTVDTTGGRPVTLPQVVRELDAAGVDAVDVALRRPSLDEVFLTLTGGLPADSGTTARNAIERSAP